MKLINCAALNEVILHNPQRRHWLHFTNPLEIISTNKLSEVLRSLKRVETFTSGSGYFAAGFISYEAAPVFDSALKTHPPTELPLLWFGIYQSPETVMLPKPGLEASSGKLSWSISQDKNNYHQAIAKIKTHIARGESYQVNYTIRQQAQFNRNPWHYFLEIAANAHYGAFIDIDRYTICSASPELFFELSGSRITSRPMKGTAPRGRHNQEDEAFSKQLCQSPKERAENAMIVDMIRNDIGKIAKVGSVNVPQQFVLEKYPTVWQMTSTVTAKTSKGITEILQALFPCASITGAPKVRTMKIIRELEGSNRNIYTGSIGYIAPDNYAQFNVSIRTALIDKQKETIEYGVGGGIVWDSTAEGEYKECLLKAQLLKVPQQTSSFLLLETILWTRPEGYFLIQTHLNRMADSAHYFDFVFDLELLRQKLNSLIPLFRRSPYKVRLLLSRKGDVTCQYQALKLSPGAVVKTVRIARRPVDSSTPFLFHKTTHREVYQQAQKDFPEYYDVILWNENHEVTESCNANIVINQNGLWLTPPVRCGLLNGVFRSYLLDQQKVSEGVITLADLKNAGEIYLINSVRKWQKVKL